MSTHSSQKPFYLRHPWNILFDLVKLSKIQPWNINIASLVSSFLEEMMKKGYIDFEASGTFLLSSSIVLRLQSEHILKLEEVPQPPQPSPPEYTPPPLQIPFRYEYTLTTIDQLMSSLEEILKSEKIEKSLKLTLSEEPPPDLFKQYDSFFVEVESRIEEFYRELKKMDVGTENPITFSEITRNKSKLEVVRIFLILLFLASRGSVRLFQEGEFGEIWISLKTEDLSTSSSTTAKLYEG